MFLPKLIASTLSPIIGVLNGMFIDSGRSDKVLELSGFAT